MDNVDLYILGAGVYFPDHLTVQTLDALGAARGVCTNMPADRLSGLPDDLRSKTESLWGLYQDGRLRSDNYADVVAAVMSRAEDLRPFAWLTTGHPTVFDSVTARVHAAALARGWRIEVVPAISCVDTLLADTMYDPASGLLIHEASGVFRRKIPLNPDVATMLLQPSAFLSDHAQLQLSSITTNLAPLQEYLKRYYPDNHRCAFVRSAESARVPSRLVWTEIGKLAAATPTEFAGTTLFIPRAG